MCLIDIVGGTVWEHEVLLSMRDYSYYICIVLRVFCDGLRSLKGQDYKEQRDGEKAFVVHL